MKLKVCGMRTPDNIARVGKLSLDFMGFIFYPESKRYVGDNFEVSTFESLPESIKKVGVFVNEKPTVILEKARKYNLDYVQLHGGESLEDCIFLKETGIEIIKVFSVQNNLPINELERFSEVVDFFLFDTQSSGFGGSGKKFDWSILEKYSGNTPYFLSGGIDIDDIEHIFSLNLPGLCFLDVNSKFEISPGLKDVDKLEELVLRLDKDSSLEEI
ncbi:MAG: phosphoribosylanthranilate isomerase [Bacteroidetes bacterium]|nr:phosphoribosylanthranilate isomerase [Bacteroidota bacterium]MDA1119403.1 phosphoribosylanthranilate isomerase [Bacteroidota bacterium]